MKLAQLVGQLKGMRADYAVAKAELNAKQERFEMENRDLILKVGNLFAQMEEVTDDIRDERVAIYDGKDKSAICGVSVKEYKKLVYDEDEALKYAKERLPDAIITKLDTKVFDKIAETGRLDFVEIRTIPKAFVAKELP